MSYLRKNFAYATLASDITYQSTQITVSSSTLPTTAGEMTLVIWDYDAYLDPANDPHCEIVIAQYVSSLTYSIVRGQDNTTATAHLSGERVGLHYTAEMSTDDLSWLGTIEVDETGRAANKGLVVNAAGSKLAYTDSPTFAQINTSLIKTNSATPTDLTITTGAEKTILLSTVVWDDMRIIPGSFDRPGVSDPTYHDWQPGGSGTVYKALKFDQGQYAFFTIQLPHSYKQGESIYVHIHWTPGNRGTTEGTATVAWKIDYTWANINGVFGAGTTANCTDACQNTNDHHLMTPEVEITGTGKTTSSVLMCKIYRDTGDTWSGTAANGPILLEVDFHYPNDTIGSRARNSK